MIARRARRSALPVALVLVVSGCSLMRTAETPAQRFYAAQGTYNIVAQIALEYVRSPTALPSVVQAIRVVDAKAYSAIEHGSKLARASAGKGRDAQLEVYAALIAAAADELRAQLVRQAEVES